MEWTNSVWAFLRVGTLVPRDSYIAEGLGELTKNPYLPPKLYEEVSGFMRQGASPETG